MLCQKSRNKDFQINYSVEKFWNKKHIQFFISFITDTSNPVPLLLIWINFNLSMDK